MRPRRRVAFVTVLALVAASAAGQEPVPAPADSPRPAPRLVASWLGHEGPVHGLAVSPGGDRVVTAGDDGTLRLWNAADGRSLFVVRAAHESPIWAVAFLPSGRIVSGGQDGLLKTWDEKTGREIAALGEKSFANGITTLAPSPDGRLVATGGFDSIVRLWDLEQGKELRTFKGHADTVWTVAFAPDGKRVFSGSFDGTVRVFSTDADAALATWTEDDPERRGWKRAMALVPPDGRSALLGGAPDPREWDVATGRLLAPFDGAGDAAILTIALAQDGNRFATGGFDGRIRLFDRASRKSVRHWDAGQGDAVWALAFSSDGRLLSAGASGAIHVWESAR